MLAYALIFQSGLGAMFKKILIANRGEIAMRIIRACRELNIATAAIYSEADSTGIYVKKADEAYVVGPGPVKGFLDGRQIVDLAVRIGADAIHPGYGFLSENAEFAELCQASGVTFIGPSPYAITMMGSKVKAREIAQAAGVPIVPGTNGAITDVKDALTFAKQVGYPLMIKASAGGGGRGLRVVRSDAELRENMETASREAQASFGDGSVFIEKYIERPHHIEFQILGDRHGHIIHLGERDCSIQRRHQKLIEIAPSLILTPALREEMGRAAIAIARAVDYDNAGTVEFLLDQEGRFYFIEMNPRLQVEHTVTEQITAIDIVRHQISIAAGLPLDLQQKDIVLQGHAIQCRINAEDPKNNFMPCTGTVTAYLSPGGIGVRIDGAVYKDYTVPPYYDALLAKLTVRGRTWEEAVSRMRRSLEEYVLRGVKTTIPFMEAIMQEPDFMAGRFDTSYLETHPELYSYHEFQQPEDLVLAISAAIAAYEGL
ncbi:Pyruvate carboxylase, subunit A [Candidatus Nitrospira inopinata]|uniref:Pyruvate carboxylase, subunit A n=2 Tax=Candidatus Nitrospira inopinata TaxID=1715989 RepID=A0A0S4KVI3_9BACT|nr:Pyruvate carboxylase, subunit A [Candidatus Nitrospira inopinata]